MINYIYLLQHRDSFRIYGVFRKKEKAENYINKNENIEIIKLKVL